MNQPKYNIGDEVWKIGGGILEHSRIMSVEMNVTGKYFYVIGGGEGYWLKMTVPESSIFPSKESLIESLK